MLCGNDRLIDPQTFVEEKLEMGELFSSGDDSNIGS